MKWFLFSFALFACSALAAQRLEKMGSPDSIKILPGARLEFRNGKISEFVTDRDSFLAAQAESIVGLPVEDFVAPTLGNGLFTFSDWAGQVVVLLFGDVWDSRSLKHYEALQLLSAKFRSKGLRVAVVTTAKASDFEKRGFDAARFSFPFLIESFSLKNERKELGSALRDDYRAIVIGRDRTVKKALTGLPDEKPEVIFNKLAGVTAPLLKN